MADYTQWTDERLEKSIKKFEEAIQNDIEDFLEALQYNSHKLLKMQAERKRRRASTAEHQETEVAS
jgi:hypothetical protein